MTDARRDLLVEIGTEELPSSELERLHRAFADQLATALTTAGLGHGRVEAFATPRRLAVRIADIATTQPDETVEHRGPPAQAAFDDSGAPTRAAEGFAKRHGVSVGDLERRDTGKAEYLFHVERRKGRAASDVLPELLRDVLDRLPARKRMRWGAPGVTFPRPVHWAVLLLGEEVVECELLGVRTDRVTRGHRFHHPAQISLDAPSDYVYRLREPGHVIAGFDERREMIREQVIAAAHAAGGEADVDEALLGEVASLVEWPVPVTGTFDRRFLDVPAEALVAVMKDHQKYFPVYDTRGRLQPLFITISNIDSEQPDIVRAGNERVIEPRLADAEFFWQQDLKSDPDALNTGLASMTYHPKLGSVGDRVARMRAVVQALAGQLDHEPATRVRISPDIDTAARYCKFDLLTQMVGEFPELQGIMGGHYLRAHGRPEAVWRAVREHYLPAFAGDDIPETAEGRVLALADRLDVLVGLFAIGQPPTGDRDPYALRRAALGALRIIIEGGLDLDLFEALRAAAATYTDVPGASDAVEPVFDFMMDRLRVHYLDRGIAPDTFAAVLARRPLRPLDFDLRIRALHGFRARPEAEVLGEANKRIHNILRKADEVEASPDPDAFAEDAERALSSALAGVEAEIGPRLSERDYPAVLECLATLADPLGRFFDDVMVMADDDRLRRNRIALLHRVREPFLGVADLSLLQAGRP